MLALAVPVAMSIVAITESPSDMKESTTLAYAAGVGQLGALLQLVASLNEYARARDGLEKRGANRKDLEKGKDERAISVSAS